MTPSLLHHDSGWLILIWYAGSQPIDVIRKCEHLRCPGVITTDHDQACVCLWCTLVQIIRYNCIKLSLSLFLITFKLRPSTNIFNLCKFNQSSLQSGVQGCRVLDTSDNCSVDCSNNAGTIWAQPLLCNTASVCANIVLSWCHTALS